MSDNNLSLDFDRDVMHSYEEAKVLGYNPGFYLIMFKKYGGVGTAKKLLSTVDFMQDGFTKLWELKRLDLSIEAIVIKDEYSTLFVDKEKEIANKRLDSLGYIK